MVAEQALLQQVNEAGLDEVFGVMIDFYSTYCAFCAFMSKLNRHPLSLETLGWVQAVYSLLRAEHFLKANPHPWARHQLE